MANAANNTGQWEDLPPMQSERKNFAAAAVGEKIYVFGGWTRMEALATAEVYDTRSRAWTALPSMPSQRASCAATAIGNKIYVIGGVDGEDSPLNTVEAFDTATNTWSSISPMSKARFDFASTAVNGKLYIFGGYDDCQICDSEIYDPRTDSWSTLCPMENERDDLAATSIEDKIYVVGGRGNGEEIDHGVDIVEMFDTAANNWEALPSMTTGRKCCAAAVVCGMVCVFGGNDEDKPMNTAEAFDKSRNRWIPLPQLKNKYDRCTAVVSGDEVFVLGYAGIQSFFETCNLSGYLSQAVASRKRSSEAAPEENAKRPKATVSHALVKEFLCPITTELPADPVLAEDGRIYERSAIAASIRHQKDNVRSPITNEPMGPRLVPVIQVRNAIEELVNDEALDDDELKERWKQRCSDLNEVKEMELKASEGDVAAIHQLGLWFLRGEKSLNSDSVEAFKWFDKASMLDHVESMAYAGYMHLMGDGTEKCVGRGMYLLGRAEACGSDYAAFRVAEAYQFGVDHMPQDTEMAKKLFNRIANDECKIKHLSPRLRSIAVSRVDEL